MSPSTSTAVRATSSPRAARRRTAAALLAATLLVVPLTFTSGPAGASPHACALDGDGSPENPYLVANAADLAKVGMLGCSLAAHYRQTADITLAPPTSGLSNHVPIGPSDDFPFTGLYEGQGRRITGLVFVGGSGTAYAGLFGLVQGGRIENVHVTGTVSGVNNVGGLAGAIESLSTSRGAVVASSAGIEVSGSGDSVGGLVGYIWQSDVESSWASGDVSGVNNVGGLVGYADVSTVVDGSWASGDVTASGDVAGGLIGYSEATITESYATGDVVGTGSFSFGGLVGDQQGESIRRSYAAGSVTGATYVGGLVGYSFGADLKDVYAHGDVTATETTDDVYAGGLVGDLDSGVVERAYSIGLVTSDGVIRIHGLIGFLNRGATVDDSFWDVDTSGFESGTEPVSAGAVGLPSAGMKLLATYADAAWDIVPRVQEPDGDGSPVWGILAGRNGGYPFLQAIAGTSSAESSTRSAAASALAVSCAPALVVVGGTVTCTVTGGDPGIDILWRAAYNPVIAEAGVTLDADGAGSFSFVVPRAALGQLLTVELVEWTAPVSLGVVAGPVPGGVPAGEGSSLPAGWLLVLVGFAAAVVMRRAVGMAA